MSHLINFTRIAMGTSLLALCSWLSDYCQTFYNIKATARSPLIELLREKINPVTVVKLVPMEILAGTATSYADLTIELDNSQPETIALEITRIEIVAVTQEVLLTSRSLIDLSTEITLKPGKTETLQYRLQSEDKVYKKGQKVYARVYYRQDEQQLARAIVSQPQAAAFMIP